MALLKKTNGHSNLITSQSSVVTKNSWRDKIRFMQSQEKQALEYLVAIMLACLILIIALLLLASPTLHALKSLLL